MLAQREREGLGCLVRGMSYKAVAAALGISIDTVRALPRSLRQAAGAYADVGCADVIAGR